MMLIKCPYCDEKRPEVEFAYKGEAHIARPEDPSDLDDANWEAFLFKRSNTRGVQFERWLHIHCCARFFNAVRDTVSDKFLLTYKTGEAKPTEKELAELSK